VTFVGAGIWQKINFAVYFLKLFQFRIFILIMRACPSENLKTSSEPVATGSVPAVAVLSKNRTMYNQFFVLTGTEKPVLASNRTRTGTGTVQSTGCHPYS